MGISEFMARAAYHASHRRYQLLYRLDGSRARREFGQAERGSRSYRSLKGKLRCPLSTLAITCNATIAGHSAMGHECVTPWMAN